ncbi:MAG: stage II sporulation protein D [Christensenellales bacterium]
MLLPVILLPVIFPSKPRDDNRSAPPAGEIEIIISEAGKGSEQIAVWLGGSVVSMPLEEYLVGVVAAEMPASFELEALKAQAVAARTYTVYKSLHGGCLAHKGADICTDSSHCQAYLTAEKMASRWNDDMNKYLNKIIEAVLSTRGEMIYYEDEQIQVFYHASSGGRTENSENVYSKALPYLVSVKSEGEENSSNYYGTVTVTADEFKSRMRAFSPGISFKNLSLVGKITRYDSGRVNTIQIGSETFTGREIRGVFSLNSANFRVDVSGGVTFSTVGFGHGVGLSQTGANAMAKQGSDYIDILTHYFSGVTVK